MTLARAARGVVLALAWVVGAAAVVVLVAVVAVPRATGAEAYTVLSPSMEPHLSAGDMVVVRPVAIEQVGVGTVITYQLESGRPAVVTHRVVAQGIRGDGRVVVWTRGDANPARDDQVVIGEQVRGQEWYFVPWVGHASAVLDRRVRSGLVVGVALGLLGYALLMFRRALVERR
jgi:signal peptidase